MIKDDMNTIVFVFIFIVSNNVFNNIIIEINRIKEIIVKESANSFDFRIKLDIIKIRTFDMFSDIRRNSRFSINHTKNNVR